MKIKTGVILCFVIVFFSSCNRNPLKVDISDIHIEVELVRFEEELFSLPLHDTLLEMSALRNRHTDFLICLPGESLM